MLPKESKERESVIPLKNEDDLIADEMGRFYSDPLGYVNFAYDWDHGDLSGFAGPDDWQSEYLDRLGYEIKSRGFDGVKPVSPIQMATSSGHGIGKSALTSWICGFLMSTRPFCKGVVTANTSPQLRTKTWAEVQKWNKRAINSHWFHVTSGQSLSMTQVDHPESWRIDAQTCAKENSEAFAGLHAANSTPFYIFDEASAIDDVIWEVAEGGMTDGEPMWFAFGNPTRSSGRFHRSIFGNLKHRWLGQCIDSRTAKMTNKAKIQEWLDDYGEDSDFFRVRVRGVAPRAGNCQFIPSDAVDACKHYEAVGYDHNPIVIGVDVARFGDDQSVICIRQGRKTHPLKKYRGLDNIDLSNKVIECIDEFNPDGVLIDGGGVGSGVIDYLRHLNYDVTEINFGAKAANPNKYVNKRAEMWDLGREAIKAGLDLPSDDELCDELVAVEYGYNPKQLIQLEKKEDMKKRGLASPDCADALMLTFAAPVMVNDESSFDIPDAVNYYE